MLVMMVRKVLIARQVGDMIDVVYKGNSYIKLPFLMRMQ